MVHLYIILLLVALPTVVQAQWEYTFNNTGTIIITRYTGPGGSVTIPNTINVGTISQPDYVQVTDIGSEYTGTGTKPFESCPGLTNITIGSGLINIVKAAFYDCTSLTAITVDTNNPVYSSLAGVLFDKHQTTLLAYPEGITGSYTIPNSVSSIGDFAFDLCTSLTSVTIPSSIRTIGDYAFTACTSLPSVTIPNSVITIGDLAFAGCTSLPSVTIPSSVRAIGDATFQFCTSLTGVYFQGNAPSYGGYVFYGDTNVTVYYLPGTTGWGSTFGGRPTALWNPQVQTSGGSFGVRTHQFGFTITGTSGLVVVVEACTNPVNRAWSPVQIITLTGSYYFSDPQWTNYPARLYRIRSP